MSNLRELTDEQTVTKMNQFYQERGYIIGANINGYIGKITPISIKGAIARDIKMKIISQTTFQGIFGMDKFHGL